MRRRPVAVSLTGLVLAAGCGGGRTSGGAGLVSVHGRVGALQVDRSDRAAVIAFAGRPDAERHGRTRGGFAGYDALGYGCADTSSPQTFPLVYGEPTACRTIFFLDGRTGGLETFFTSSARYAEAHGVHVRTAQAVAERLLHRRLVVGCETNIYLSSRAARLTIAFTGGVMRMASVRAAHVYAFILHSLQEDAGVFDCM